MSPLQTRPTLELICRSGIVVSFFTGGAFCGAGLAGPVGDRVGRKWTIFAGSVIYLLGGALQTGASNLNMLWAGRWMAGLGVGFLVMISKSVFISFGLRGVGGTGLAQTILLNRSSF
jgi:MFS family permease